MTLNQALAGVTVTLDGSNHVYTDMFGQYNFSDKHRSMHTVVETDFTQSLSSTLQMSMIIVSRGYKYAVNLAMCVDLDIDDDGLPVLGAGPDGSDTGYDGNGDGIQIRSRANVTSLHTYNGDM